MCSTPIHVFLGVPYDTATTFRPARGSGRKASRQGSAQLCELKSFPHGFNPLDYVKAVDYGDVYFDHAMPQTIPARSSARRPRSSSMTYF
jgi:agmatinase